MRGRTEIAGNRSLGDKELFVRFMGARRILTQAASLIAIWLLSQHREEHIVLLDDILLKLIVMKNSAWKREACDFSYGRREA